MSAHRSAEGFDLTPPTLDQRTSLESTLTPDEGHVLLHHGTEAAFCGGLLDEHRDGVFTCRLCGLPLFLAGHKFTNSISLQFTRRDEPLPDLLGRGAPEGKAVVRAART